MEKVQKKISYKNTDSLNEQYQAYKKGIAIYEFDWVLWAVKGAIEFELDEKLLAEKSFEHAILLAKKTYPNQMANASFSTKNNSRMAYCFLCLGRREIARKDFTAADKYLKESFRFNNFDSQTTTSLWFSQFSQGKFKEANHWLDISQWLHNRQSDLFNTSHYIPSTVVNQ